MELGAVHDTSPNPLLEVVDIGLGLEGMAAIGRRGCHLCPEHGRCCRLGEQTGCLLDACANRERYSPKLGSRGCMDAGLRLFPRGKTSSGGQKTVGGSHGTTTPLGRRKGPTVVVRHRFELGRVGLAGALRGESPPEAGRGEGTGERRCRSRQTRDAVAGGRRLVVPHSDLGTGADAESAPSVGAARGVLGC